MTRRSLLLTLLSLALVACGYAPRKDPPLFTYDSPVLAQESARLHARDIGGTYHQNLCCGSMVPLIQTGDWVVVAPVSLHPFTDDLLGRPCVYQPQWSAPFDLVLHRFISGNARDGFIASGDGVRPDIDPRTGRDLRSESRYRVTAADYRGQVVGIYRVKS